MKKYMFFLPIGDWSRDGHEKCDYKIVISNKSVEEVREIHFKARDTLPFSIEEICCVYQDQKIDKEMFEIIKSTGLDPENYFYYHDYAGKEVWDMEWNTDAMAELWIDWLKLVDPDLELEIKDLEMIPFYGRDKKNRHISFVGYGLFD